METQKHSLSKHSNTFVGQKKTFFDEGHSYYPMMASSFLQHTCSLTVYLPNPLSFGNACEDSNKPKLDICYSLERGSAECGLLSCMSEPIII